MAWRKATRSAIGVVCNCKSSRPNGSCDDRKKGYLKEGNFQTSHCVSPNNLIDLRLVLLETCGSGKKIRQKSQKKICTNHRNRIKISYLQTWIPDEKTEITEILHAWNEGIEGSEEKLLPIVYAELKKQARIFMSRERSNHTLQPTALVNEAFIRIADQTGIEWVDRKHFYGIASRLMRQILVDHARKRNSQKAWK